MKSRARSRADWYHVMLSSSSMPSPSKAIIHIYTGQPCNTLSVLAKDFELIHSAEPTKKRKLEICFLSFYSAFPSLTIQYSELLVYPFLSSSPVGADVQ